MDKLEKLYSGVFVVFLLLAIYIFFHYYNLQNEKIADLNSDGIIDNDELAYHIRKELDRKSKSPPSLYGLVKSAASGAMRGALMGLLLNGVEGAATSAIVLGLINPIITGVEFMI